MGKLELTDGQVNDLLALMNAFTDRCLVNMKSGDAFPVAPPGTSTTRQQRLYFPDCTHRMHPAYPEKADL